MLLVRAFMFISSKQLQPLSIVSAVCAKPRVASTCDGELTSGVSMRESGKITSEWKEKLKLYLLAQRDLGRFLGLARIQTLL